jgi:hypothetical protein
MSASRKSTTSKGPNTFDKVIELTALIIDLMLDTKSPHQRMLLMQPEYKQQQVQKQSTFSKTKFSNSSSSDSAIQPKTVERPHG